MKCVKFIGMDNKKYAVYCSDYQIVENAEDDKRLYYFQNGNRFMVRFAVISIIIEDYVPGCEDKVAYIKVDDLIKCIDESKEPSIIGFFLKEIIEAVPKVYLSKQVIDE